MMKMYLARSDSYYSSDKMMKVTRETKLMATREIMRYKVKSDDDLECLSTVLTWIVTVVDKAGSLSVSCNPRIVLISPVYSEIWNKVGLEDSSRL
uniref:Uncharacterized protein n=1 Tax=Leptobrachium leishanense TaxID=445787 RepID=A0A8C5W934_9ANUR